MGHPASSSCRQRGFYILVTIGRGENPIFSSVTLLSLNDEGGHGGEPCPNFLASEFGQRISGQGREFAEDFRRPSGTRFLLTLLTRHLRAGLYYAAPSGRNQLG